MYSSNPSERNSRPEQSRNNAQGGASHSRNTTARPGATTRPSATARPGATARPSAPQGDQSSSSTPSTEARKIRLPSDRQRGARSGRQGAPTDRGSARAARQKQFIHPSRFIQEARVTEKSEYETVHAFTDFSLNPRIISNVVAKGYIKPSPIQDKTIPLVMAGKDVVGIANTGTGKTAAFALPMIHDLIHNMDHRALIMAPTRELAQQIQEEIIDFSKGCNLKTALIIGGASMIMQERALRANPRIIIGTPGRIKDHVQKRNLHLASINYTVLDEFDRMLDMGFIRDITEIFSKIPATRQSLFFSATMEPSIEAHIKKFAKDPTTISVVEGVTADGVKQDVVFFSPKDSKIDLLHDLLISSNKGSSICAKTIIFDDTKRSVEKLGKDLAERGFRVDQIHGNKSQAQRSRAIKRLKTNEIDILVATDVAARGIDVSDISRVINFSQPNTYDDYIHRIGRTGRAGKTGEAYTFMPK